MLSCASTCLRPVSNWYHNVNCLFLNVQMDLLEEYIRIYVKQSEPNVRVYVYIGITDDTISVYKSNLSRSYNFLGAGTKHIFVKPMKINIPHMFIYDNFINPNELVMLLSSEVIPHNHKVYILYVVEDKLNLDHPIGNQFVMLNTIATCDQLLSQICNTSNTWLNSAYNRNCFIGQITESRVIHMLFNDRSVPERSIDTYLEEFILVKTLLEVLSNVGEDIQPSLLHILDLFNSRLDVNIPPTMRFGESGVLKPTVFNAIMNINKVRYCIASLDCIIGVRLDQNVLKSYFIRKMTDGNT